MFADSHASDSANATAEIAYLFLSFYLLLQFQGTSKIMVNDFSNATPHICKLSPASDQHIEDLYYSGGIGAIMHELDGLAALGLGKYVENFHIMSSHSPPWGAFEF